MSPAWHHLLFLHWPVEPDALRALLPPGLELDLFQGRAYVGFVPFTMTAVRPHPLLRFVPGRARFENFHEANVRTYVRCGEVSGVWFFSLDTASRPAVCWARAWFHLPYFYARMSLRRRGGAIEYSLRRRWPRPWPARCRVRYMPTGSPAPAAPGTLEHFLIERNWLFSHARGHLWRGRVRHRPYQLQPVKLQFCEENCLAAAGIARPATPPLAHYARRVQTEICPLERVEEYS
jgi:uncharacterized protein YqjF (DUF2071 family)